MERRRYWFEDSSTYQAFAELPRAEGHAQGLAEGKIQGRTEEARRLLLVLGTNRLRKPPGPVVAALNSVDNLEHLERLFRLALTAATWMQLVEAACALERRRPRRLKAGPASGEHSKTLATVNGSEGRDSAMSGG